MAIAAGEEKAHGPVAVIVPNDATGGEAGPLSINEVKKEDAENGLGHGPSAWLLWFGNLDRFREESKPPGRWMGD